MLGQTGDGDNDQYFVNAKVLGLPACSGTSLTTEFGVGSMGNRQCPLRGIYFIILTLRQAYTQDSPFGSWAAQKDDLGVEPPGPCSSYRVAL